MNYKEFSDYAKLNANTEKDKLQEKKDERKKNERTEIAECCQHVQGAQGIQGCDGSQGPQGVQGVQGPQGLQGCFGLQGARGTQGPQGIQGTIGNRGYQGFPGCVGTTGYQGFVGVQGKMGKTGTQGVRGPQGFVGPKGAQGVQGPRGDTGLQGVVGYQGTDGRIGIQGLQGELGGIWVNGVRTNGYNTNLFVFKDGRFTPNNVDDVVDLRDGAVIKILLTREGLSSIRSNNGIWTDMVDAVAWYEEVSYRKDAVVYDKYGNREYWKSLVEGNKGHAPTEGSYWTKIGVVPEHKSDLSPAYYGGSVPIVEKLSEERDLGTIIEFTYRGGAWNYSGGLLPEPSDSVSVRDMKVVSNPDDAESYIYYYSGDDGKIVVTDEETDYPVAPGETRMVISTSDGTLYSGIIPKSVGQTYADNGRIVRGEDGKTYIEIGYNVLGMEPFLIDADTFVRYTESEYPKRSYDCGTYGNY